MNNEFNVYTIKGLYIGRYGEEKNPTYAGTLENAMHYADQSHNFSSYGEDIRICLGDEVMAVKRKIAKIDEIGYCHESEPWRILEDIRTKLFYDNRELQDLYQKGEYKTKRFKALQKEVSDLTIEYNKANNCYYREAKWITTLEKAIQHEVLLKNPKLTGNNLIDAVANELNKVAGVMLQRNEKNNTINYSVDIVTPYKIYNFTLSRGYDNNCNLEKYKFDNGDNKCTANIVPFEHHICEIVYGNDAIDKEKYGAKLYELKEKYGRDILEKPENLKDFSNCLERYDKYLAEIKEKQKEEEKACGERLKEFFEIKEFFESQEEDSSDDAE